MSPTNLHAPKLPPFRSMGEVKVTIYMDYLTPKTVVITNTRRKSKTIRRRHVNELIWLGLNEFTKDFLTHEKGFVVRTGAGKKYIHVYYYKVDAGRLIIGAMRHLDYVYATRKSSERAINYLVNTLEDLGAIERLVPALFTHYKSKVY